MSLTRDTAPRSADGDSSHASASEPGKTTRSGALALQRKANAPAAAAAEGPAPAPVDPGEDPFALHLPVQRKADGAAAEGGAPATSGGGSPLPAGTQSKMESSFGADFSDVRVHEGPQAAQLGAVAYAQGTDVHFAPGQYNPGTAAGDSLIGHELAHVQQQRAGQVATPQGKGAPIVDDHGLEGQADRAGERAARGEPVGEAIGAATGGSIQKKDGDPPAPGGAPVAEHGADTFGLKASLEQLKAKTGVSGDMGKFAELKVGITAPPVPQLGGGRPKIDAELKYLTSGEGNELEVSLHVGVKWGIDLKLFKAEVEVFGEGKIKLKFKNGEMMECLNAAVKGVLFDALKMMNVRNCASLASPLAARATEWAVGSEVFDYDVFTALNWLAASPKVPAWVQDPAKESVAALKAFFGSHKGGYEVSIAIGVGGEAGGGADGKGLKGGATAKAVHGISSEDGQNISDETRRNELVVEGALKLGDNEGKIGYTFGGGRNVLSAEGSFITDNSFDFEKAKILSMGGILKLIAAAGLGTSAGKAVTAPSGAELVNALVGGLASGAGVIGNKNLKALKKQYKLSVEIEREGEKPWSSAKVDAKLFLGNTIGGEMDGGALGEVEARATVGTFISITREVKEHLPGGGGPPAGGGH